MKNIIFSLIATIGLTGLSFGQAVLEHTYESSFNPYEANTFLTEDGLHFSTWTYGTNIVQIYNSSHTLIKTINIPSEIDGIMGISLVSDKLFNNDNLIEFIISSNMSAATTYYTLINENGIIL